MDRVSPTFYTPAHLPSCPSLLQVGKLPQVVYRVQLANLYEPSSHSFHDLPARFQALPPMRLPFEEIAGV